MKDRDEFDMMLSAPLKGAASSKPKPPTQQELESEGADFLNFMGSVKG